jgi:hypothetical protein
MPAAATVVTPARFAQGLTYKEFLAGEPPCRLEAGCLYHPRLRRVCEATHKVGLGGREL